MTVSSIKEHENSSIKKLKEWLLEAVEAAGFEDAMYMGTDRFSMPWISGGGLAFLRQKKMQKMAEEIFESFSINVPSVKVPVIRASTILLLFPP